MQKKYFEIYKEIKNKIMTGQIKAGEKLHSKRVMADRMGVSVITVEKAYNMLLDEGYILSKERSGYFASKISGISGDRKEENAVISYLKEEKSSSDGQDFEYSVWFKTIRKVLSESGDRLFIKSPSKGCAALRNAIAEYLLRYRGMVAQPEQIIIGSGAEQLYEMVVKLIGRDKTYGIEDPSYSQIEAVYKGEGVQIKKLKMGTDGIETRVLLNGNIDVLHVTPYKSYPSDVTTSVNKRMEYLKWAKNNKFIVEDDFNSEFFIPGQPTESLYQLGEKDRVIYINTFSKSLSSSMRTGYMILPKRLSEKYEKELGMFSCTVPVLDQYILAEFIKSGNFERHLNRQRRKMNTKI